MRYLCLVHIDETKFAVMSQSEIDSMVNAALDSDDRLRASGHYVTSAALEDVRTATTVRVRNDRLSTTDGPFAETKEQLGGFVLVEAVDIGEAVQLAATIPMARIGSIEVRPVLELQRK